MADLAAPPAPAAADTAGKGHTKRKKDTHPRDPAREVIETIVFVVVLVLLLKLFVTEAFVIPTGSMAETLYGYQKLITCPKCGHEFPVNSHDEVEANQQTGQRHPLIGYTCPNCRFPGRFDRGPGGAIESPPNRTGDRVLVLKPIYHVWNPFRREFKKPDRGDVVVFKFPEEPQQKHTAQNYIKRAMGFGGETVGIHRGELFVTRSLDYPPDARDADGNLLYPRPENPDDLWKGDPVKGPDYRYTNNQKAADLFEASRVAGFPAGTGGFEIVRKTDEQVLACRRIVWDNDKQPKELAGKVPARWYAETPGRWTGDDPNQPRAFAHEAGELDWIRYRHLVWDWTSDLRAVAPGPVDNFLGYNAGKDYNPVLGGEQSRESSADRLWVGDLILECEADFGDGAEVVLELSKGVSRFQARFAGGKVTLARTVGPGAKEFGSRDTRITGPGKHRLRFANVDCRLRVWVDDRAIDFGPDADYPHVEPEPGGDVDPEGWTRSNDVAAPAGIGAKGRVTVRGLKLYRDIYYTRRSGSDHTKADLYYVHPGHYLCLGDNSAQSSDSRTWGLVPERLMLGKAVFVFWPAGRIGFIK